MLEHLGCLIKVKNSLLGKQLVEDSRALDFQIVHCGCELSSLSTWIIA